MKSFVTSSPAQSSPGWHSLVRQPFDISLASLTTSFVGTWVLQRVGIRRDESLELWINDMNMRSAPRESLPFPSLHPNADSYVNALLSFVTESETFQTLCGQVHILDFLTKKPDLFTSIFPPEWRDWLLVVPISDILDLLMREDLEPFGESDLGPASSRRWRGHPIPPASFLEYIRTVRSLCLERGFESSLEFPPAELSRDISAGMKPKKAHEVTHFAAFVDNLMSEINSSTAHRVTHVVDFGSGRNYLGRVLASPLYQRQIIAVESKQLNISGARNMDISSKLVEKAVIWRNKKEFRATGVDKAERTWNERASAIQVSTDTVIDGVTDAKEHLGKDFDRIQYVEHCITDGDLRDVFAGVWQGDVAAESEESSCIGPRTLNGQSDEQETASLDPEAMVVSLHSCGNLLHHGLRSLILNPRVKVVAMIGCCYNLTTERLGPPTMKHPALRPSHRRVEECASAYDPHGFPMSDRLMNHPYHGEKGIRLNITARMMAVQAPQNWTKSASDFFFTRHFYRALFQKILVDTCSVRVDAATEQGNAQDRHVKEDCPTLGSLRKDCYKSFLTYVRGAIEKLGTMPVHAEKATILRQELSDEAIESYWQRYMHKKHQLCIIWSLMGFSAGVVESLIVTDRWLFLREQEAVSHAWVQTVFDYGLSPRNLVVVGIKK